MTVEHEQLSIGWYARFEGMLAGAKVMEIEGKTSSIIISRASLKSAINDWVVEFRDPAIFSTATENYYINKTGVVYAAFVGHRSKQSVSSERFKVIYEEAREDRSKGEALVRCLEDELSQATLVLRNGRQVADYRR